MNENTLLIIFTKNPVLGEVKTRLAKRIGPQNALEVYQILLDKTAKVVTSLPTTKMVYFTTSIPDNGLWAAADIEKRIQKGNDLGERMMNAVKDGFDEGFKSVVLIGSDLYDLTPKIIEEAFEQLLNHEVVIGPAQDGGYYLIGLRSLYPGLFQNKDWGASTVLRDTLSNLEKHDVALLEVLNDIDIYEDLEQHLVFKKYLNHYQ